MSPAIAFDLTRYLRSRKDRVEAALQEIYRPPAPQPATADTPGTPGTPALATLTAVIEYSLLAGGKRLRPILAVASCEAVGGPIEAVLPAACALEMIHTYSLIHDDLPSMDDDDFRRGRPTSHKAFGEAMAILAGDALLTDAFGVAARCPAAPNVVLCVLTELSQAAGSAGMVGGQVIDIEATPRPDQKNAQTHDQVNEQTNDQPARERITLEHLSLLHRLKTGALLRCAVRAGALLGGAATDQLAALTHYGEAVGLAFQIIDDVLDVTADLATLGKDPGSDRDAGKTTFVDLLGVAGARSRASEVMAGGLAALDRAGLGPAADPLRALGHYTLDRDR